jgi:hypothetical protein
VVLLPIVIAIVWYSIAFLPHVVELNTIAEKGRKSILPVENDIYRLAVIAEGNSGIRNYAVKSAYRSLALNDKSQRILYWHFNTAFWYLVSYLHFDNKDMFYIWATYAPFEKGQGLALSAKHYFGKEINMLTKEK